MSFGVSRCAARIIDLRSNRLVDLIAEDKAIEDTMYHLHRALNSGRIDLDRFIRVGATIYTL